MKRLLVLGASDDFVELTKNAVERGIYTVVLDSNPYGIAKQYASKSYDVDINSRDEIKAIIEFEKIDHILTSFSDNMFELMVNYSAYNGLETYCKIDKVRYVRDKFLMKNMLRKLNIPTADAQVVRLDEVKKEDIVIEYPFVVKPVDGWGSKEIYIVKDFEELRGISNDVHGTGKISVSALLENWNRGHELNIMSWIKGGNVTFIEFADREVYGENESVIPHFNRIIHPSIYMEEIKETVREYLCKIACFLEIKEGPLSTQLFYNHETKKISIGEVAGRFFGGEQFISRIINGVSVTNLLLNMYYDKERNIQELKKYEKEIKHCSVVIYIKARKGIVRDMGNSGQFSKGTNIDKFNLKAYPGASTTNMPVLASIYAHFDNRTEADEFTERVYEEFYIPDLKGNNLAVKNKLVTYEF